MGNNILGPYNVRNYILQRLLEDRNQLKMAQINLYRIFNNRRINATIAPILIGLLPSAAVVTICGDIVTEASRNSLNEDEKLS